METNIEFYASKANLPETPEWDDTEWSDELDNAISQNYGYIATPEGFVFKINNRDSVTSLDGKVYEMPFDIENML